MRLAMRSTDPGRTRTCLVLVALALAAPLAGAPTATAGNEVDRDGPRIEQLWSGPAPGALGDEPKDRPALHVDLPEASRANGTAVVVCPGGGYGHLAMGHEGVDIARWLNSHGVAAFVLDYRHRGKGYGHPAPLQDAQRALRKVRAGSQQYRVAPDRIGVLGFSAGGHLASTLGTHFDDGDPQSTDPVERVSCRPDFLILCYPVILFGQPGMHAGSQRNLLGDNPPDELVRSLSNEQQVTARTPPTFIFHTDEDRGVPAENSVRFYLALRGAGVPAELHIYQQGAHGLGLAPAVPETSSWPDRCVGWLRVRGLLTPP